MKLILHACCAPCLIHPLNVLQQEGIKVWGFFYNPNIHGFDEFTKRHNSVLDYAKKVELPLIPARYPYPVEDYFRQVNLKESPESARCSICWTLRLKETARIAKINNFDYFSTTLLVSPYQDQETLKSIGMRIAEEEGVAFFYRDFRDGFRKTHDEARDMGMYMQKYCGCIYSERERHAKHAKHSKSTQVPC